MYSVPLAYLLWLISGFGVLGLHRFYLGKIGSGLIWLFTGGLFMFGSIYDFFTLPAQVHEANIREQYRQSLGHQSFYPPHMRTVSSQGPVKKESLERIILRTAKQNNGRTTPSEVALQADIPLETAKKNLDKLAEDGYAELRVTKSGVVVYVFPELSPSDSQGDLEDF